MRHTTDRSCVISSIAVPWRRCIAARCSSTCAWTEASRAEVISLNLGIIFVAAVGFGALPGVLALALHSVGMVGRFYAEAVEHVDPRPLEAARAGGTTRVQVITHAVQR
jgi:ABC-type proline/glycine betaine transport system permease subunit